MKREDILKFTNSIVMLSKLLTRIEDRSLAQKLHVKITNMMSAFIEHRRGDIASHNIVRLNLISATDNILDYLELLVHNSKSDVTPLLATQRNLLKFKLHILKIDQLKSVESNVEEKVAVEPAVNLEQKPKPIRSSLRSNSNKERIFSFIKHSPNVRTREVVDEFSALSDRTVKRNLKELTDEGFLKRKSGGGAVHYLAV